MNVSPFKFGQGCMFAVLNICKTTKRIKTTNLIVKIAFVLFINTTLSGCNTTGGEEDEAPTELEQPTQSEETEEPPTGDAQVGETQFNQTCSGCHTPQGNGVFGVGIFAFDVNYFTYPTKPSFSQKNYSASSPEGLTSFINAEMPSPGVCIDECAANVAAYLWANKSAATEEPTNETSASCSEQEKLLPAQLRRLTQAQLQNSITDIYGNIFSENDWPDMQDGGALLGMSFSANRLVINSLNMESLYDATRVLVDTILQSHASFSDCALGSDTNCVDSLINDYGLRTWRRPLTATETSDLNSRLSAFTSNQEKLQFALNYLLLSSNFLFRSELGESVNSAYQLSNYELASALSYSLWNTTPDETLLTLASEPSPFTESELIRQVDRMLSDSRADHALMGIYKDILKLDLVLTQAKSEALNFTPQIRTDTLTSGELMLMDGIVVNEHYMGVFEGSDFYINNTIEALFGLSGFSSEFVQTPLNSAQRSGILNHPAYLAGHSTLASSGIVQRGVFTLEQLLCSELPPPPAVVASIDPPEGVDPSVTSTRDLLQITHSAQAQCRSCHQSIDPAGFGYENFDTLGRYRTVEKEIVPIDASGVLDTVGDHILTYNNSAEYSQALTASPQMQQCVSRRFLEHYVGLSLEPSDCELQKYQSILEGSNNGVRDLIYSLVKLESFATRAREQ